MRQQPPRLGSAAAADVSLAEIRGRRQRLAAAVKSALLALDRYPLGSFPSARQPQRDHERQMLELALAPLLAPAPEVEPPKNSPEADLQRVLKTLDEELELAR